MLHFIRVKTDICLKISSLKKSDPLKTCHTVAFLGSKASKDPNSFGIKVKDSAVPFKALHDRSGPVTSLTPTFYHFSLTCLHPSLQTQHPHLHLRTFAHMHSLFCLLSWLPLFRSLLKYHLLTEAFPNHLNLKF